jgi:hypothetical protein
MALWGPNDHNADRTIWCRDDVVKELLLHSLLGGFQKNCLQLFQDTCQVTWIFKILEKWSELGSIAASRAIEAF